MLKSRRAAAAALVVVLSSTSLAFGKAGDTDPGFGSNGFAKVTTSYRVSSFDAPMVQAGGRIVFAGLATNQSDKVYLRALNTDGTADTSFGTAGETITGVSGKYGRAAVAMASDGKVLVAGASSSNKFVVERFNQNGTRDTAWGSNGAVTVTVPDSSYARPTALTATANGAIVSVDATASGRQVFTVVKVGPLGADPGFGSAGVARSVFTNQQAVANDVAILPDGKVLLSGSVRPSSSSSTADTALARFTEAGAADSSFGTGGRITHNISGGTGEDYAAAVAPLADGRAVLTGPSTTNGMVARIKADGTLDSSFGQGGKVVGGLMYFGFPFYPSDVSIDAAGKPVITGSKVYGDPSTTRWAVMRLTQNASPTLDTSFGSSGRVVFSTCLNKQGAGPSGLTISSGRILLAGGCDDSTKTAVARLMGTAGPASGPIELNVSPGTNAAGHERIPLAGLDPSAAIDAAEDAQATAMRRTAMRRTAMRRTDLLSTAMRRTAMRRTGLLSTAMRRTALRYALLSEVSLEGTTWQELLGTEAPLQTLTMEDAYAINPEGVGALTLDDIDLNSTAMRRTSLAAIVLGIRPLSSLPEPDGGWCSFLADQPYNCSNGVDVATSTLVDLEILGDDLSAYLSQPISLLETDLGTGEDAAPIADFLLADLDLTIEPFKSAQASEFASILDCGSCSGRKLGELSDSEVGNATIAELTGLLPKPSLTDLSVGDVVLAMLDHAEIPYESLDKQGLLNEAAYRADQLTTYTATVRIDCDQSADMTAVLAAPGDARPAPDGATASLDGGPAKPLGRGVPAERKSGPFTFALAPACAGQSGQHDATIRFLVEPGSSLGPFDGATLSIVAGGTTVVSNEISTRVDDSRDPGDQPDQARAIGEEALLSGHISSSTDSDFFTFQPSAGRTTISLSHLPADYDLVIYGSDEGVEATAMRRTAMRRTAMRRTPVEDDGTEPIDEALAAPDQIQDIAMRRTDLTVRATSIQRGTADEAASIVVGPEEAGDTFIAHVVGYNGAFEAPPYILRRSDAPQATSPACPARSLPSGSSIAYPNVPASTEALYLVAPSRMGTGTQAMLDRLQDLAAATDGVVLPVDNSPRVPTGAEFAAWDSDPCSVARANDVVTQINEIVDDERRRNGGLPQLRSIVLVGPDDVIPQARIPDRTVIGQESEYADDATVDRNGDGIPDDNSVSSALRQGYFLSDDPYGDFDPAEGLYAPDVALGRLVETPAEIEAQADAFLTANGSLRPQRSFVTGYDFLKDGSEDIFGSLSSGVPSGASSSRIDETWTADDALGGLNAPGAGFLSVNAHYDHYRALPAAAFNGTDPNLISAAEADVAPGSVAFTVGCHSGLNLSVADASQGTDPLLGDWAERMSGSGAIYAANTGYGYGDDAAVAYSELVMAEYARGLVAGVSSAGQALMLAKQRAIGITGVPDIYWAKASMEATFYGLPMYVIGDGTQSPSVVPPLAESDGGDDESTRSSTPVTVDLRDDFLPVEDERGTYTTVRGHDPLVVNGRPIQPKLSQDETQEGAPAHGFVLESLTTVETQANPAIARATIDLAAHEPEPESSDPFFPATLATVEPVATAEGRRDMLTLIAGSYRSDRQRLNLEMGGRVLRSTSNDYSPPTIRRVDGLVSDGGFSIRVDAEGDDLLGGTVLYITDADKEAGGEVDWHRADLSLIAPGVLSAGGVLPSGTTIPEAIVQVYDRSFNVAYSTRKVEGHTIAPAKEGEAGDPQVIFDPPTPASGYFSAPPSATLDAGDHDDATFEVSLDGSAFVPVDGPVSPAEPAEGEHVVTYRGSDGSIATARFAVDREGPSIVAEADRPANDRGWFDGPVTFSFTCGDAVSGVADCPAPRTLSEAGANQSFTVSATDRAGNSEDLTVNDVNIDTGTPTITASPDRQPNQHGWYKDDVSVEFSCEDDLSGIALCGNREVEGAPLEASDSITISSEGRELPATGSVTDLSGRSAVTTQTVSIDRTDPTSTITTRSGAILVGKPEACGHRFRRAVGCSLGNGDLHGLWEPGDETGCSQLQLRRQLHLDCRYSRPRCLAGDRAGHGLGRQPVTGVVPDDNHRPLGRDSRRRRLDDVEPLEQVGRAPSVLRAVVGAALEVRQRVQGEGQLVDGLCLFGHRNRALEQDLAVLAVTFPDGAKRQETGEHRGKQGYHVDLLRALEDLIGERARFGDPAGKEQSLALIGVQVADGAVQAACHEDLAPPRIKLARPLQVAATHRYSPQVA